MNTKVKGYLLGAIAAATYGMNPLFALPLYRAGMDPDSVLFFRYLTALPVLAVMIKARGRSFKLRRREVLPLAVMGVFMALSSLTLFAAYNYMAVGIASTLLFIYPIIVALIMTLFFKEKLTMMTVLCILLALGGIGLLYRGEDGATLSLTGVVLVVAASFLYATYIVGVNCPWLSGMPTLQVTFYVLLFGLSVFIVRTLLAGSLKVPDTWYLWGNVLALAIFPTCISFVCTTQAIHCIGSTPTAILGALEPLTAIFFGVVVFGEQLTPRIVCGMVMIILAVTLIIAGGSITKPLVRFRKMFPSLRRKASPASMPPQTPPKEGL